MYNIKLKLTRDSKSKTDTHKLFVVMTVVTEIN